MASVYAIRIASVSRLLFAATIILLQSGLLNAMQDKNFEFSSLKDALYSLENNIPEQQNKIIPHLKKYLNVKCIESIPVNMPAIYIASKIVDATKDRNFGAVIAIIPMGWLHDNKKIREYLKKLINSFRKTRVDFYFCHICGDSFSTSVTLFNKLDKRATQRDSEVLTSTKKFLSNEDLQHKICYLIKVKKNKSIFITRNKRSREPAELGEEFKRLKLI